MDLEKIQQTLEANTKNGTLKLPPAALDSTPVKDVFRDYLLDADLVVTQVSIVPVGGQNITVVGQGASFPFENAYITAVFTAPNQVAAMTIQADGFFDQTKVWRFSTAFPSLSTTFYKDLQFTAAVLTLRSANASVTQPGGLFFSGKQELTGKLAVLAKLLSGSNEVDLSGAISVVGEKKPEKAVPVMVLEDPAPGEVFGMQFLFQLIDASRIVTPREGQPPGDKTVPVPLMQLVSRINVDTDDGKKTLDIKTHFTTTFGLLTFQADMSQALNVSQAALNALARGANLGSVLPAQLPLVNNFKLGQWSMSVIPDEPRISSISMEAGIAEPWTIIPGLFTLEQIDLIFTINHLKDKWEPTASLSANVRVLDGDAQFNIVVDAQYPSFIITGSLEQDSKIDLIALVKRFLGESVANSLPCKELKVTLLTLLLDPKNSTYTFDTVIKADCSFDLGVVIFTLTQVEFNFSYVAGETTGSFAAAFWLVPPPPSIAKEEWFIDDPPPGAIAMEVSAAYNGKDAGWSFRGGLAPEGKIDLKLLIARYLPAQYQDFVPNVVINKLEAGFETGTSKAYDFAIGAEWTIETLNTKIGALVKISSALEDGVRKNEGEVQGFVRFGGNGDEGGLELKVTAKFNDASQEYIFEFLGWKATLSSKATKKTLTFEAGDKSLGEMIEVLINAVIPGADIKLAAPWSVLNSIPLKSFKFTIEFDENSSPKTAGLTYSPNINLGFAELNDIALDYDVKTEKIMFRITKGRFLQETIGPDNPVEWDVADPESTKQVPGEGSEMFRLDFLGMGQHMAVAKTGGALQPVPASIFPAVKQLSDAFADKEDLTLVFNEATNWLIAARFTVVQAVDIGIVFYDPELYGLVISVTGSKAADKLPVFKGLIFEILYKKISDTIGMWQIDLTLPEYIRNLQFGAVSVTLPSMKLQIYTNGDFMVDLGFPANDDYSRSFSVQALPFVGSGGLYFGVLSSETSDKLPTTTKGNFSPVIAFGLGLRVGLGKDLNYGVFKAGASVTLQGVLEGILAWYSPYPAPRSLSTANDRPMISGGSYQSIGPRSSSQQLAPTANRDDFYYMIQARVALVGKLYGSVDLGIISANLDIEVRVGMRLTLEAYRPIDIFFEVNVSVTLSVKINLGLFKISIDLSFKMNLNFSFTIGDTNQVGPWASSALLQTTMLRQSAFVQRLDAPIDAQCPVIPPMKWQPLLNSDPVQVPLLFVPQFTAGTGGPLGTGVPRTPYVVAMTYVSSTPPKEPLGSPAPFDKLAQGALLWTLNAYLNRNKENTTVDDLLKQDISIVQLKEIYCYLTQKKLLEPFTVYQVLDFLKNFFRFHVTIPPVIPPASAVAHGPDEAVSIFPIMPLLKLKASTGVEVDFFTKTPSSADYLDSVKKYFEEMAVRYKSAAERAGLQSAPESIEETDNSLASFIFLDFFALLARSTIQDAINLLQAQQAPLQANESLADFVRNHPELAIDVPSLALANATRPLRAGIRLRVPGVVYTAKQGDTAESVATKLNLDVVQLRSANPEMNSHELPPASTVKLPAVTFTTSSTEPESLLEITRRFDVSLTELALANQDQAELFPADEPLLAPYAQQKNIGELAAALQANKSFNNLSGLAARVLLQGLRPPSPMNSPQAGKPAPLYELTGQQFDGSNLVADSTIELTVPDDDKEWFQLGAAGGSLTYTFTQATADMLAGLKTASFGPAVTFKPAELLRIEPRRFSLATNVLWHTPVSLLAANRGDELPADTIEPRLWQFPSELLQIITGSQALQPKVGLWTQRQEGPGQKHPKQPVTNYTWSTTIELKVRQTASGDKGFLPNTYELIGIDAGGTQLLENLIVWYANQGRPVIDKLRILYPPNPAVPGQDAPPTGLTSDPDPAFFLLQTNLSTASQPPQLTGPAALLKALPAKHDPLGQSELEFLKLLWEASIVNSGGYVLSYEAKPGSGLPDYLFSQDGVASLTLLITYTITDNVLQNFLNNVVIRQVIDTEHEVLYALPVPQTVSNLELSSDESLADIAARYRVTISQLATQNRNAHAKLATGKHLRIPPVTRRVRAGERLETIAARARLTPEAVAAVNPETDCNNLSASHYLRLPERLWRAEGGDSLASLAERFNTSVVTLAHANRNVPGLIQGELTFDDRLEEAIATIPPGNIEFHLIRPNAASPSPDVTAPRQLSELYNLLAYRIKQGNGFRGTKSALPVSPDTPEGTSDWVYDSVVPVFPFETQSADTSDSAPDPAQDPYNGVGKTVELNFNWQDLFGNWIDSEVHNQNWPDHGFSVGYIDKLIALDQWPSVTSDYVIVPRDGSAQLSITLRFNATAYLPAIDAADLTAANEMALTDLDKFRLIYYQLTQDDVRVTVSSTMQAATQAVETASAKDVLVQFVLEIIKFLTPISAGQPAPPAPAELAISQPVTDGNSLNLFALIVRLEIERNLDLVNEQFKDVPAVASVTSRVPANAAQKKLKANQAEPSPPLSLQEFAQQLETAFPNLKVMVAAPKKSLGETAEEIWIARFAPTETGIAFTIDGAKPSFYSVEPLARNLLSRPDVLVYRYQSGKYIATETPVTTAQHSVDLDQLGRNFLAALEQVLGPQFSASTWKLEYGSASSTTPVADPPDPKTHPYEAIVAAKELLATAISAHVANVFEDATPSDALADARESLRQQLLVNLTSAYTVDVILQYPVTVSHSEYASGDLLAPRLFGKPVAQNPNNPNDVEKKDAFSFSTSKFSLAKRTTGTYLTFSFDTNREQQGKDGQQFDDVFKIDLFHQINALEHKIHPVKGIEGYKASSWLTFVLPDSFDTPGQRKLLVSLGEQTIPVPLRAYPTPPSLSEQTFVPLSTDGGDQLRKARLWDYRCHYEYVGAAHDKILASLKLNVPPDKALKARFSDATNPDLFAALVQFTEAYPDIAKDLDQYLATGTNNEVAFNAIRSFAWLVQRAANAWQSWQNARLLYSEAPQESTEYHFEITQQAEDVSGVPALVVTMEGDGSSLLLPQLPQVEIGGYETKVKSRAGKSASYYFISEQDQKPLTYETGRNLSSRQLVFKDFDILKIENAWAGAAIKRNERLLPNKITNPNFVFQSPVVRFANVLTPLLDLEKEIDIAVYTETPAPVSKLLSNFLIAFFEGAQTDGNEDRTIRLSAAYSYELQDSGRSETTVAGGPDLDITIPILLTLPTPISILKENLSPDSPLVKAVSETIDNWFLNKPSGMDQSGKLLFDLSVYSSLSKSQLPVLRLRRLGLATKLVLFKDARL